MKRSRGRIVIVAAHDDAHLDFVRPYIDSEIVTVEPYALSNDKALSYLYRGKESVVAYGSGLLNKVSAVWYRKPEMDLRGIENPHEYRLYMRSAQATHVEALYSQFSHALWVSDYYAINRASNKPLQLEQAGSLGFRVPDTLTTSSEAAASRFMQCYPTVIVKSEANVFPIVDGLHQFFPSTKVARGQKVSLRGLHHAPAIFQQAIEVVADIRVTVIGKKLFAARVYDREIEQ
ncbi:MAG: hypothetical protein AAB834_03580 [Patescibacteria group bacterium]